MGLIEWFKNIFSKKEEDTVVEESKEEDTVVEESKEDKIDVVEEDVDVNREDLEKELDEEQKRINLLYVSDGLTDEVLQRQVALNTRRSELNIPDKNELVDGWSQ